MSRPPQHRLLRTSVAVLAVLGMVGLLGAPIAGTLFGRTSLSYAWADGARSTLAAASIVMVVSFVSGLLAGGGAALGPPLADALLASAIEIAGALPTFVVVVIVRALSPASDLMAVALVLSCVRGLATAKVVRVQLLQLRNEDFVLSARALGATRARIFGAHLFPHVAGPSLADAAHAAAAVVALDAALALAGFGASTRTWGTLFAEAVQRATLGAALVPGLGVAATVGALMVVASAIEAGWSVRRFI